MSIPPVAFTSVTPLLAEVPNWLQGRTDELRASLHSEFIQPTDITINIAQFRLARKSKMMKAAVI
jgi:hypothetical protein